MLHFGSLGISSTKKINDENHLFASSQLNRKHFPKTGDNDTDYIEPVIRIYFCLSLLKSFIHKFYMIETADTYIVPCIVSCLSLLLPTQFNLHFLLLSVQ